MTHRSAKEARKRARYVAGTIGLLLRHQAKGLTDDDPMVFVSSVGQMRFIRRMLFKAAKK